MQCLLDHMEPSRILSHCRGPYMTIWDHKAPHCTMPRHRAPTEPCKTILDSLVWYEVVQDHTEFYRTIWDIQDRTVPPGKIWYYKAPSELQNHVEQYGSHETIAEHYGTIQGGNGSYRTMQQNKLTTRSYGTIQTILDNMGPYLAIYDTLRPFMTARGHTGPYGMIRYHKWPFSTIRHQYDAN